MPKSPYLNQATHPEENTCQIFPPKKYRHRNFQPSPLYPLPFPFTFNPETDAKVISGAFEGIYAWISLNFLKGRFIPENSESTLGILEVGGASHQNAFENPSKETISLTVGRKTYHLFARSYLGYGLDEARKKYFETLAQNPTVNGVLQSPCHHNGFQDQISISGRMFTIRGTAQVEECRSIIQQNLFLQKSQLPIL